MIQFIRNAEGFNSYLLGQLTEILQSSIANVANHKQ